MSSGVLGAMVCIVGMASTQDFAGAPLPRRQREAQRSGVSQSLGCRGFWNQPRFGSPDLQLVLLLWKTGRASSPALGKADSPAKKVFKLQSSMVL